MRSRPGRATHITVFTSFVDDMAILSSVPMAMVAVVALATVFLGNLFEVQVPATSFTHFARVRMLLRQSAGAATDRTDALSRHVQLLCRLAEQVFQREGHSEHQVRGLGRRWRLPMELKAACGQGNVHVERVLVVVLHHHRWCSFLGMGANTHRGVTRHQGSMERGGGGGREERLWRQRRSLTSGPNESYRRRLLGSDSTSYAVATSMNACSSASVTLGPSLSGCSSRALALYAFLISRALASRDTPRTWLNENRSVVRRAPHAHALVME